MNLGQMKTEIGLIVKDNSLVAPLVVGWINDAILEVATDYDLPPLALADPYEIGVDDSKWLWSLPDDFHKNLFRAHSADRPNHHLHIYKNPLHLTGKNHTQTGDRVRELAVIPQGKDFYLGIHPLPLTEQTLDLWYYQKPAVLEKETDVCDCIPFNFVPQVIYPKLIIKNYQFIVDQVLDFPFTQGPLQYWMGQLKLGLQGAPGQGIGLLTYFNINYHPPRITGGRHAIGRRPYYHGSGL